MNNNIYQSTPKELQSMLEATKHLIEILDAKYEKANLRAITKEDCLNHLSETKKDKLLKLLQEFEEYLMVHCLTGIVIRSHSNSKREYNHIMADFSQDQKYMWKP